MSVIKLVYVWLLILYQNPVRFAYTSYYRTLALTFDCPIPLDMTSISECIAYRMVRSSIAIRCDCYRVIEIVKIETGRTDMMSREFCGLSVWFEIIFPYF